MSQARRCGFCRRPGHTIGVCNDPVILCLVGDLKDAANYSIAYHTNGQFFESRLSTYSTIQIRACAGAFGLGGIKPIAGNPVRKQYIDAITDYLYISKRDDLEDALVYLEANPEAMTMIDQILKVEFTRRIRYGIRTGLAPGCQREEIMYNIIHREQELFELTDIRDRAYTRQLRLQAQLDVLAEEFDRNSEIAALVIASDTATEAEKDAIQRLVVANRDQFRLLNAEWDGAVAYYMASDLALRRYRREQRQEQPRPRPLAKYDIDTCCRVAAGPIDCPICYDAIPVEAVLVTGCKHEFCGPCFTGYFDGLQKTKKAPSCALCREPVGRVIFGEEADRAEFAGKFCNNVNVVPLPLTPEQINYNMQTLMEMLGPEA